MSNVHILQNDNKINFSSLSKKHLLIDTNYLIDSSRYQKEFDELTQCIKNVDCTLTSIDAVFYEFTKGSKSLEDYKKKVSYYKTIIGYTLSIDQKILDNVNNLSRTLLKKSGQISYTDSLLLATLMKYQDSIYLLTSDRSDVPCSIFPIKLNIYVETIERNCLFSVYGYSLENYAKALLDLQKEINK